MWFSSYLQKKKTICSHQWTQPWEGILSIGCFSHGQWLKQGIEITHELLYADDYNNNCYWSEFKIYES